MINRRLNPVDSGMCINRMMTFRYCSLSVTILLIDTKTVVKQIIICRALKKIITIFNYSLQACTRARTHTPPAS